MAGREWARLNFNGGLTDNQKWLLFKSAALSIGSPHKLEKKTTDKQLPLGRQRRQNTIVLRSKIKSYVEQLDVFSPQKLAIKIRTATP